MAENKTKFTNASVEDYIDARGSVQQRADCRELIALLKKATRQPLTGVGCAMAWVSGAAPRSSGKTVGVVAT